MTQPPPIMPGPSPLQPPPIEQVSISSTLGRRPRRWRVAILATISVVAVTVAAAMVYLLMNRSSRQPAGGSTGTTSSPSATGRVATIGQYAGMVNSAAGDYADTWTEYSDECMLAEEDSPICELRRLTLDAQANTIVFTLIGAAKPGVPAYIGSPPAELERLVADTIAAAQQLADVIGDDNRAEPSELFAAGNRLERVLDRWEPYI